ncbi:hypothetical protein [Bosea sp. (in: a-proteobacteria)]|uniref:hypothetical protein n=1 Tax=Bosea sp. (in: a-proteobacteria) TaxID=1871050 RepID=UPI003B3AC48F
MTLFDIRHRLDIGTQPSTAYAARLRASFGCASIGPPAKGESIVIASDRTRDGLGPKPRRHAWPGVSVRRERF